MIIGLRLPQIDLELISTSAQLHHVGKFFELHTGAQNRGILEDTTKFLKDAPIVLRELLKIANRFICLNILLLRCFSAPDHSSHCPKRSCSGHRHSDIWLIKLN